MKNFSIFKILNWKDKHVQHHFIFNILCGIFIAGLLYFIHHSDTGHKILNIAYDYLVIKDFNKSVLKGKLPISDNIHIIAFDKETYETSLSKGFWTPRKLLGESILKSLQLGAKTVVLDFALNKPVPVFCRDEDENRQFLDLLNEAVKEAKKRKAVIIIPKTEKNQQQTEYEQEYHKIFEENPDVIKTGIAEAFENTSDYYQIRHFRFYERTEENQIFFSVQILAVTYFWHGLEDGSKILEQTKKQILSNPEKVEMQTQIPINLYPHNDLNHEFLPARYIFRLAQRDIAKKHNLPDILVKYPQLSVNPHILLETAENIYKDKIVLIGSVNPEMGDEHITPVGKMHGIFLISNGINMFLQGLQISDLSDIMKVITEILIILASAVLFLYFHYTIALLISAGILSFIFIWISPLFFSKFGLFTDFLFPIAGMGLHRIISGTEEFIKEYFKNKEDL